MSEEGKNSLKVNKLRLLLSSNKIRNCKTTKSSITNKSKNSIGNSITEIKNNLKTFSDYLNKINKKYYDEFIIDLSENENSKIKGK